MSRLALPLTTSIVVALLLAPQRSGAEEPAAPAPVAAEPGAARPVADQPVAKRMIEPAPPAVPETIKVTAPGAAKGMPAPPYASALRESCEEELRKDATWKASLRELLRREVRSQDADEFIRNKRHVIIAYAVIWLLTVAFLVIMWRRQRGFEAEIDRLRGELERAIERGNDG